MAPTRSPWAARALTPKDPQCSHKTPGVSCFLPASLGGGVARAAGSFEQARNGSPPPAALVRSLRAAIALFRDVLLSCQHQGSTNHINFCVDLYDLGLCFHTLYAMTCNLLPRGGVRGVSTRFMSACLSPCLRA